MVIFLSNSGPKRLKSNYLFVYHCNLNRTSAHNFSKIAQLKVYNSIYKHDFLCLSEAYQDLSTPFDEKSLQIEGLNLGHPKT